MSDPHGLDGDGIACDSLPRGSLLIETPAVGRQQNGTEIGPEIRESLAGMSSLG